MSNKQQIAFLCDTLRWAKMEINRCMHGLHYSKMEAGRVEASLYYVLSSRDLFSDAHARQTELHYLELELNRIDKKKTDIEYILKKVEMEISRLEGIVLQLPAAGLTSNAEKSVRNGILELIQQITQVLGVIGQLEMLMHRARATLNRALYQ